MNKTLLVFGHGYTANVLSAKLLPLGWTVFGTVRRGDGAEQAATALRNLGVIPVAWQAADVSKALAASGHVLVSTAPAVNGDPVLREFSVQIGAASHLKWLGYLSTTAVYGNHNGGWVDEATPLTPTTHRGHLRVAAEADWRDLADRTGLALHVFRLAGIYGPGRGPFAKLRAGTARRIIKENQLFSRIHVEDIAQILLASLESPTAGAIFNLCDDAAAPPEDVLEYAAKLLELPVPESIAFEDAEMTPMARSFYAESKRVRNDRVKSNLRVSLIYKTYRDGLKALLRQEKSNP